MTAFSPEAFGKYYLVDKIATGGMAEIFKAKTYSHGGFENLLVIKRILSHLGENEEFVEMFIDEAKVSVALQHPNIVRIFDFGKLGENYFIAMECVEGKDVRNVLRKLARDGRYLPHDLVAYIGHEVAKGLDHAHRKTDARGRPYGIVHRDISPSNLLVSYDGEVKIADFGIAKAESNAYETADGMLKGKFEYMSPEQATGQALDHRSDLFSLGIILHEMLTGRRLFKEDNEIRTLERIRAVDVPPPSSLVPGVPPELDRIVMKALSLREDRYQWAQELQEDLQDYLFPATADTLRDTVSAFMRETFAQEIADELSRLEAGSTVAERLHADAPAHGWDGHTEPTLQRAPRRAMWPLVLLLAVLLVLVSLGSAAAVAWMLQPSPAPEQVVTTGGMDIVVLPAARITVDGTLVGESDALSLDDLAPGEHHVVLEAPDHVPAQATVTVRAGEVTRLVRTLAPRVAEEPTPEPTEAPEPVVAPPVVVFRTSPSGATVRVDGVTIGTTPVTWTRGRAGASYRVAYTLDGHEPAEATVSGLRSGERTEVRRTLEPEARAPGSLTVALIGGGWAHVYLDGEQLPKTAPLSGYSVPAGRYEVRVENPATGLAYTETVKVGSGQTVTVRARAE